MERGNKERKQRRTNKFHSFAQNHVLHQNRNYLRESPKIKTTNATSWKGKRQEENSTRWWKTRRTRRYKCYGKTISKSAWGLCRLWVCAWMGTVLVHVISVCREECGKKCFIIHLQHTHKQTRSVYINLPFGREWVSHPAIHPSIQIPDNCQISLYILGCGAGSYKILAWALAKGNECRRERVEVKAREQGTAEDTYFFWRQRRCDYKWETWTQASFRMLFVCVCVCGNKETEMISTLKENS